MLLHREGAARLIPTPEPIDGPDHRHVEAATNRILQHEIELWPSLASRAGYNPRRHRQPPPTSPAMQRQPPARCAGCRPSAPRCSPADRSQPASPCPSSAPVFSQVDKYHCSIQKTTGFCMDVRGRETGRFLRIADAALPMGFLHRREVTELGYCTLPGHGLPAEGCPRLDAGLRPRAGLRGDARIAPPTRSAARAASTSSSTDAPPCAAAGRAAR